MERAIKDFDNVRLVECKVRKIVGDAFCLLQLTSQKLNISCREETVKTVQNTFLLQKSKYIYICPWTIK